jgi:hypothetical protein
MVRKSTPQPLTLQNPIAHDEHNFIDNSKSPLSATSPKSPRSPFKFTSSKKSQGEQPSMQAAEPLQNRTNLPTSQTTPSLSPLQQYSGDSGGQERQERERPARSGFFSNYKASKSSSRLQPSDTVRQVSEDNMSRDTDHPAMSGKVSPQETTRTGTTLWFRLCRCHLLIVNLWIESSVNRSVLRKPVGGPGKSDVSFESSESPPSSSSTNVVRKNKPKPFSILSRTKSIRDEQSPEEVQQNDKIMEPDRSHTHNNSIRTAPLRSENDRSFREMMSSGVRQRSEDRQLTSAREVPHPKDPRENGRTQTSFSTSFRESGGHAFLNNLKSSATKGAGAISKGLFGKGARSGSTNEREQPVDDEHYELKVINKPLVEQTRLTRISKKLEDSRDKTEFWMPAFPWRAIDYLNYKGSDVEGLYRVPGSGPQIKKWQRRFDEGKQSL